MSITAHGANLFDLSKKYSFSLDEILDFSSNINPFGASEKALSYVRNNLDKVSIYPDPSYHKLKSTIGQYIGIDPKHIILGNGATNLISGFIEHVNPKHALVISPSYSEYEHELKKNNSKTFYYSLHKKNHFQLIVEDILDQIKKNDIELLILCNPNNPTGSLIKPQELCTLLTESNSTILVDETYIEFTDQEAYSSIKLTEKFERLFVIRGTSKFFSTPGIRLGYGVSSNHSLQKSLSATLDLWGINIFATLMGEIMFLDGTYLAHTHELITNERAFLMKHLSQIEGLKAYPSEGNFILCEILRSDINATSLYEKLIKDKIAIRDCSSFLNLGKQFFRICTLTHSQNQYLITKLQSIFMPPKEK